MMQISFYDENGNLQQVRAGRALSANPFPTERSTNLITATGLAANTIVSHDTTHNPSTGQYNSISLGLYVDVERSLKPRRLYASWAVNATADSNHLHGVLFGVWDTNTNAWLTPIQSVYLMRRNASPGGGHEPSALVMAGSAGNNNGQVVGGNSFGEFTIAVPKNWYDLLENNPNAVLRFFMALRNNTATDITAPWRAFFTVLCF